MTPRAGTRASLRRRAPGRTPPRRVPVRRGRRRGAYHSDASDFWALLVRGAVACSRCWLSTWGNRYRSALQSLHTVPSLAHPHHRLLATSSASSGFPTTRYRARAGAEMTPAMSYARAKMRSMNTSSDEGGSLPPSPESAVRPLSAADPAGRTAAERPRRTCRAPLRSPPTNGHRLVLWPRPRRGLLRLERAPGWPDARRRENGPERDPGDPARIARSAARAAPLAR